MSDPNWSVEQALRNAELAAEIRSLRNEIENRYREDQQREQWQIDERREQSRKAIERSCSDPKGVMPDSFITEEEREMYGLIGDYVERNKSSKTFF